MSANLPPRATGPAVRAGLGMASVALAILLLVGFKAPQDGVVMGAARTSGGNGTTTAGTTGSTGSGASGSGSSSTGSTTSGSGKTYDGTLIQTRYGLVQVEITVKIGKVVTVTALELPVGGRSGSISSFVAPILSSEALSAQSSQIDIVSGATYTSSAYAQSLQAALDQAGI
ncbi:MAG TPA: FMN-binding protein [Candidatus Limnocylindrales bacterium]|nr:FMN-binding protein [Candidatus Limnocylindrales bacterium]